MAKVTLNTSKSVQQVNNLVNAIKELKAAGGASSGSLAQDLKFLEDELEKINQTGETTVATFNKMEQAARRLGITSKSTIGAYERLNLQYKAAVKHAKDLATMYGKTDVRAKAAAKSAKDLGDRIERINSTTKKASKGLIMFNKGMGKLIGFATVFIGLRTFLDIGNSAFDALKKIDAMNFSMRAVITTEAELVQTTVWLKDITNAYGANIVATTQRYIKFRAAAGQANLTLRETQKIFETVTKVAGVLGLKTDELTGIYLALEQMISKGKVTTEELRRQLGERLPGAVDILAKSMGITTVKLGEMMKKGEVITKDVLPAFAEEIEKTFGLGTIDKVETLIASQTRLENAWISLINTINGSEGAISEWLREGFEDILGYIEQIEKMTRDENQWLDIARATGFQEGIAGINEELRILSEMYPDEDLTDKMLVPANMSNAVKEMSEMNRVIRTQEKLVDNLTAGYEKNKIERWEITDTVFPGYYNMLEKMLVPEIELLETAKEQLKYAKRDQAVIQGKIDAYNSLLKVKKEEALIDGDKGPKGKIDTSLEDLEIGRLKRIAKQQNDNAKNEEISIEERLAYREQATITEIALAEAVANKQVKLAAGNALKIINIEEQLVSDIRDIKDKGIKDGNSLEIKFIQKGAADIAAANEKAHNEQILLLTDHAKQKSIIFKRTGKLATFEQEELDTELEDLQIEFHNRALKAQIEFMKKWVLTMELSDADREKILQSIAELESDMKNSSEDIVEVAKAGWMDILDVISEVLTEVTALGDAVFDRRIEKINAEIDAETKKYDELMRLAEDDAAQKERLEYEKEAVISKLEAKRLKEEQKKAKFDKVMAIAQIGILTAIGIGQANSKGPLGWWEIPIIAALGALQVATVLATPIPQYKDGLDKADNDHVAMINDGGEMEYVKRGDSILTTNTKNAIVNLKKDDTVFKDKNAMLQDAAIMSIIANGQELHGEDYNVLASVIDEGLKAGFKKAKVENKVILKGFNYQKESYGKSLNW